MYINAQTHVAQNNLMLYTCLAALIIPEVKARAMIYSRTTTLDRTQAELHSLISSSGRPTSTPEPWSYIITVKLSALDSYILTIRCNIFKFNEYVKDLVDSLMARGETMQDLVANVFKAYKAVSNCNFVVYICKKEDQYKLGKDIDIDLLMLQASNRYKTMFEAKTWNAPLPEEKILALEPKSRSFKGKRRNLSSSTRMVGTMKEGSKKSKSKKRRRSFQNG